MPLKDYLKYSGRTVTLSGDFKEFARFAWNSDFVQNRFAGSMDKDLVYLMNHAINYQCVFRLFAAVGKVVHNYRCQDSQCTTHINHRKVKRGTTNQFMFRGQS